MRRSLSGVFSAPRCPGRNSASSAVFPAGSLERFATTTRTPTSWTHLPGFVKKPRNCSFGLPARKSAPTSQYILIRPAVLPYSADVVSDLTQGTSAYEQASLDAGRHRQA